MWSVGRLYAADFFDRCRRYPKKFLARDTTDQSALHIGCLNEPDANLQFACGLIAPIIRPQKKHPCGIRGANVGRLCAALFFRAITLPTKKMLARDTTDQSALHIDCLNEPDANLQFACGLIAPIIRPQKKHPCRVLFLERIMGVEPTCSAWEADILPMNYIRV